MEQESAGSNLLLRLGTPSPVAFPKTRTIPPAGPATESTKWKKVPLATNLDDNTALMSFNTA